MHGLLLVDKPEGISSNEVVQIVKKRVRPARVGHSGTLDVPASGLMVLLIGAGTRALNFLDEIRKTYHMTIVLGEETDTGDREGKIIKKHDASDITLEAIDEVLGRFRGVVDQVPPHFSALKRGGVPLHKLARKGVFPELAPRKVKIFSLERKGWVSPHLELEMVCSKGTYARAVARDIGQALCVGGRIERLRRTKSGPFSVDNAISLAEIEHLDRGTIEKRLVSLSQALAHIPNFRAQSFEVNKLMRGTAIHIDRNRVINAFVDSNSWPRFLKIASTKGDLIVIVSLEPRSDGFYLQPVRVFNTWENTGS